MDEAFLMTDQRDIPVQEVIRPIVLISTELSGDGWAELRDAARALGANAVIGMRISDAYTDPHFKGQQVYFSGVAVRI